MTSKLKRDMQQSRSRGLTLQACEVCLTKVSKPHRQLDIFTTELRKPSATDIRGGSPGSRFKTRDTVYRGKGSKYFGNSRNSSAKTYHFHEHDQ
jgi:hypothetical protein